LETTTLTGSGNSLESEARGGGGLETSRARDRRCTTLVF